MKLKNILLVVSDIEKSKTFYQELFELEVIADFGENVMLTEGLVLQEQKSWENLVKQEAAFGGHDGELYFEEENLDLFLKKLENRSFSVEYLQTCTENQRGQRLVRIYDPDRHVIEVKESIDYVVRRFVSMGMTAAEVAGKTQMPFSWVEEIS